VVQGLEEELAVEGVAVGWVDHLPLDLVEFAETLERIGRQKKGFRVIMSYKDGKFYEDFGVPEYLKLDYEKDKEVFAKL
jgi:hypothetical protein